MIELATGLINLFKSETGTTPVHNALYLDIPAKLYYEEAPQGTTFPYGIFNYVSDVHDWNLSKDHFREFLTQFTFFITTGLD